MGKAKYHWVWNVLSGSVANWGKRAKSIRRLNNRVQRGVVQGAAHWDSEMARAVLSTRQPTPTRGNRKGRWIEEFEDSVQHALDMKDAIVFHAERVLVDAMNSWRQWTFEALEQQDNMRKACAHLEEQTLDLWRQWSEAQRIAQGRRLRQGFDQLGRSLLRANFYTLRKNARALKGMHAFQQKAKLYWLKHVLEGRFERWRNYAEFRLILAELMAQADFRYEHKTYSDSFQGWRSFADFKMDGHDTDGEK